MSQSNLTLLNEISAKLDNFEQSLNKSIDRAEGFRKELVALFENFKYEHPFDNVPKRFEKTLGDAKNIVNEINKKVSDKKIEYIQQERLIDKLRDYFLIAVVGRVKMGKSTLCNALADLFNRGLGKKSDFFVLNEPTQELDINELNDTISIYPVWAKKELSHYGVLYELLKESNFKITPEIQKEFNKLGVKKIKIQASGEPEEEKINSFETDILECTLAIQGVRIGKICLLDAPGLSSGNPYSRERAKDLWSSADLLIFLTNNDIPLQATDLQLIREFGLEKRGSILFCVTKCDKYEEDEVDGKIVKKYSFNAQDLESQKRFIIQEIKKAGLEEILVNPNIVGLSAKIYNDLKNESLIKALEESRFNEFLKVLIDTLSSDGLKRKSLKPIERIISVTNKLIKDLDTSNLENLITKFETEEKKEVKNLIESFDKRLIEEVNLLKKEKLKNAEAMTNEKGEYDIAITKSDWEKLIRKVKKSFSDDLLEHILKELNIPGDISEKLLVKFGVEEEKIRKKIGRSNTGEVIGVSGGGLVGTEIGAIVADVVAGAEAGAEAGAAGGPVGIVLGVVIGGLIGSLIGSAIGSFFDEDEYTTETISRKVRKGDNFKEVEEKIDESISQTLKNLELSYHKEIETILKIVENYLKTTLKELNERKMNIEKIKSKIQNIYEEVLQ